MRFTLIEGDKNHKRSQAHRVRPARRARRSRTFEAAIARPQLRPPAQPQARTLRRTRRAAERGARQRAERPVRPVAARATRRIAWRAVLAKGMIALALAALVGMIVYVSTAPEFFVYSARVTGSRHVRAEEIYAAAGVHEQNIFWIRPERVEAAIGQIDGIKAVRVRCGLPADVRIEVEEREPTVMWRVLSQGRDWWLDGEGVVLPYHGDVNRTIFVVDSSQRTLDVGDQIEPAGLVASVRQLAAAVPGIKVFYYQADRGLSYMQQAAGEEWPVYVGTSDDLPRKIRILQTLTGYLQANNIRPRYIDVRWADHPVYGAPAGQGGAPGG